jgi:tripartite-type tricarboxylate transporter receptor subunit TctC
MSYFRYMLVSAGFVVATLGAIPFGLAQPYPSGPIEMIVPFAPGGPADIAARIIQPELSAELRVPVVVINRPGAGGSIGMDFVAKSKPNGYVVAATTNSTLVTVPAVNKGVSYKLSDFAVIGTYGVDYQAIISRPDSRWKSFSDFLAYVRKNPGKISYGSSGTGGISHFNMEILKMMAKIDITHVPYQGTGPVKVAIEGGHVDIATSAMGAFRGAVEAKTLNFLAITSPKRLPDLPGVETMAERGYQAASLNTVAQIFAPAKIPAEAVDRLRRALAATMRNPAVRSAMEKAGLIPDYRGPEETVSDLNADIASVSAVAKTLVLQ